MASIIFNVSYQYGEYLSPAIIYEFTKLKPRNSILTYLFLPIRLLVILAAFCVSIINLPFFYLNKLFLFLNDCDNMLISLIMWLINFFYFILYWIYKILCAIISLLVILYHFIPPIAENPSDNIDTQKL